MPYDTNTSPQNEFILTSVFRHKGPSSRRNFRLESNGGCEQHVGAGRARPIGNRVRRKQGKFKILVLTLHWIQEIFLLFYFWDWF